jgi:hypothetical protein
MAQPLVVLIYAVGCGACEETKPEFEKLSRSLSGWKFGLLDIDRPGLNLDFPVKYTPTLYAVVNGKRFATDPPTLKLDFTAENIGKWLQAVVDKANN